MSPGDLHIETDQEVEIEVDADMYELDVLVQTRNFSVELSPDSEIGVEIDQNPNVIVISPGFQGPAGPEGQPGPPGPPGPEGQQSTYTFTQLAPAHIWDIHHNLGRYPSVTVVDTGGTEVIPNVHYISDNYVQLEFDNITSGKAYLN